jgi:hypothetical protein
MVLPAAYQKSVELLYYVVKNIRLCTRSLDREMVDYFLQ